MNAIDVVIPAFNAARYLDEALASVLSQDRAARRIIVVDDGSTDGTADIAAKFGLPVEITRRRNGGAAAARNAGVTGDGKILLQMGDHKEIAAFASETEILKAMLRLINPGSSAVYFLAGHGERDIEKAGDASMTRAKDTLESKNYSVKPLTFWSITRYRKMPA